ncbi:MAG: LytTR family DNA-binding domain-containing protein [Rudanella sp.]|nr:LytTR family DNA-binding domain-containing protein [Rudanella sp.]
MRPLDSLSTNYQPLRAILVEDSPPEMILLKSYLAKYCTQVEVVGETGNMQEAMALIMEEQPDLLLLDIELGDATSYDLLDQLQATGFPLTCEIIFMTGHPKFDYATTAFAYSALDFLTKTIDPVALQKAVTKASQRQNREQYARQLNLLMDLIRSPESRSNRLAVHQPGGLIEFIEIDQIQYLEADTVMTRFMMCDGRLMRATRNIGQYTKLLQQHNFFPISQSILLNLNQLKQYDHAEKALTLINGQVLYASRRGGQDLRHYLSQTTTPAEPQSGLLRNWLGKLFR